ncbi:EamA family transporter [Pedobacter sp. P351]|uniref:DMT family transporter n=1 Tax=Pedobacter superstes TaxID=3133441 RepID=UPI00309EA65F
MGGKELKWIAGGLLFSIIWASAASATKIGLAAAQPLFIAVLRFGIAAFIMIIYAHLIKRYRLPKGKEWGVIAVYGVLNISIYLGCYVFAMQEVTASIGAIATATNPVFISLMSVVFFNKKLSWKIFLSLFICVFGVFCASWPLLGYASVTLKGLLLLLLSMVSYSLGAIYISRNKQNNLSLITINGWQTFLGGLFLLPLSIFFYQKEKNHFNLELWGGVLWLAIPVSIFAAQLWLWLLKINPVRAGFWLFLCPLFGALIAAWLLGDAITLYTWAGILLVVIGLLFARK